MTPVRIAGLTANQRSQVERVASLMEVTNWIHTVATKPTE